MRVLQAYANAQALDQQNYGGSSQQRIQARPSVNASRTSASGDVISLSDTARNLCMNGGMDSISVLPQDATYDQRGNVTRQYDVLQGELRSLASQFISTPGAQGLLGGLGGVQARMAGLRAQV